MNVWVNQHGELMKMTQALRTELLAAVTDADLAYRLPGDNLSLGELCVEMGETQQSYIDSLKTFTQEFHYGSADKALASSVSKLGSWFAMMDAELDTLMNSFNDAEVAGKLINRGTFQLPIGGQLHTYREALLIFYAKAALYFKGMRKPLPEQMRWWIG
jgi:hypothetical protein